MKLKDLIESGLVSDDDRIRLYVQVDTDRKRITTGFWYNDGVLDLCENRIASMEMDTFDGTRYWAVTLMDGETS